MKKPRGLEPLPRWALRVSRGTRAALDCELRSILKLYSNPEDAAPVMYSWLFGKKVPDRYLVGNRSPQEMGGGSNKLFSNRNSLNPEPEQRRSDAERRARAVKLLYQEYQKKNPHITQPHLCPTFCRKFARKFHVSEKTIKRDLQRETTR
jgi:hypothetical protein